MKFLEVVAQAVGILTEGAIVERLRRDPTVNLDPHILHAGFVYDAGGRQQLGALYRQYLDIGRMAGLPFIVCTPTWRANPERVEAAGTRSLAEVNREGVWFIRSLQGEYGLYAEQIFIGGLMGCRGDAYRPADALPAEAAAAFHAPQAGALAEGGVDFLMAATLPAFSEALGMGRSMAESGLPYVLSFVLRPDGALLDGTPLETAMAEIDDVVLPAPAFYMANCVPPSTFRSAMRVALRRAPGIRHRVIGLQGSTSERPPETLEQLPDLDSMEPEAFAEAMGDVRKEFGTRILGGCCGTDDRHIAALARCMTKP
ncbi:MAG: homocysteine S-methyltransferase family protein [candidate division NC10 bacterium]|nr:homocysteine S-methyltransferase family protein [candidate division NC10 bacterium]